MASSSSVKQALKALMVVQTRLADARALAQGLNLADTEVLDSYDQAQDRLIQGQKLLTAELGQAIVDESGLGATP